MSKQKSTKRALLSSALVLVMCVAMLIGTTFAWFTDSVTSGRNTIQSGNLDVELEYFDVEENDWVPVTSTTDVFGYDNWEPGYTKVVKFKVSNKGSLALKYQLTADVYSETEGVNKAGKSFSLSDYLYTEVVAADATREQILASTTGVNMKDTFAIKETGDLAAKDSEEVAVAIWMPTSVDNEANHNGTDIPSIEFGINLVATQATVESDSFDHLYDKDADYDGEISNATSLAAAMKNGGTYKLTKSFAVNEAIEIPEDVEVVLNLDGNDISADFAKSASTADTGVLVNNGTLTIYGDSNSIFSNTVENGGSLIYNTGTLTLDGGNYVGAPRNASGYPSYIVRNNHGGVVTLKGDISVTSAWGAFSNFNNSTLNIEDATIYHDTDISGTTYYLVCAGSGAVINIYDGEFTFNKPDANSMGAPILGVWDEGSKINIYGGTFDADQGALNYSGKAIEIFGGTFKNAANKIFGGSTIEIYVADGCVATKNVDGTYTVSKKVVPDGTTFVAEGLYVDADGVYYITKAAGFDTMREKVAGETVWENDGKWVLYSDIDLNGMNWTSIEGFHGTFDGNGKTISNMNASFLAKTQLGGTDNIGGGRPIIKDVTFDHANITGTERVGVVVGDAVGVTIENVKVTNSTVIGTKYVGGIVGYVYTTKSTITGCEVTGSTIKSEGTNDGDGKVGGIVGFIAIGTVTDNNVTGCTISGLECVGGIAGRGGSGDTVATIYGNTVSGNTVTGTDTNTVGEQIGDKLNVKESE